MRLILMRHGMTCGNEQQRYIGKTDEILSPKGRKNVLRFATDGRYPDVDRIYVSPMKRCIQTAELVWPEQKLIRVNAFRECDFGTFEGKNYRDLKGDPYYQKWIDSKGTLPFPDGEDVAAFKKRSLRAYGRTICEVQKDYSESEQESLTVAMVVHGGTIMAIMEYYAVPKKDYYDYQVENAGGYVVDYEGGWLMNVRPL